MQPVLLALFLATLHLNVPLVSPADLREREANPRRMVDRGRGEERDGAPGHLPLKMVGRSVHREVMGEETRNLVPTFDLRRKQFSCQELNRQHRTSGEARVACLFGNIWFVLGSQDGRSWQPSLEETRGWKTNQGSNKLSSTTRKKRLARPLVSRQRRADPVNPSDPLRSESHPNYPAQDHQDPDPEVSEQDQAGAVSKETITSCHDPLKVLHSTRPVSPIKTSIAERADQD